MQAYAKTYDILTESNMNSLVKQMDARMRLTPEEVFFPADFFDIGEPLGVNKVLSRMAQNEQVWRLARGIYTVYSMSEFGKALAYTGALAASYARRTNVVITEIGASAANILGFSTQNVLKEIYLTSGKPMMWLLKARTVEFRKGSALELLFGNTIEGKLVRAWQYLGENESVAALPLLNSDQAMRINWDAIINTHGILPGWMMGLARKGKFRGWS
jgi:hypothetical protein